MKTRQIFLIAGCAVAAILLAGAGYLLYDGIRDLRTTTRTLDNALKAREKYFVHDPFPSLENVEIERQNALALEAAFTNLLVRLKQGEIVTPRMTPSTFVRELGKKQRALSQLATNAARTVKIDLPDDFAFGFDAYFAGRMRPEPEHVADLTRQLLILERLFGILFEEEVATIVSVTRDEVEKQRPSPSAPQGVADPLYTRMHFGFTVKTKESALLRVLNRMAAEDMFVVVTSVAVHKEQPDVLDMTQPAAPAGTKDRRSPIEDLFGRRKSRPAPEPAPTVPARKPAEMLRSERVVCGHRVEKPVTATIEVDVYRFKES